MATKNFKTSVFINCPFDEEYEAILQAILFCLIYLGFSPRIAKERLDSGEYRLDKIKELIRECRFAIHDLSRCQSKKKGEYFRLNMPFELGLDYGCKQYGGQRYQSKRILVLEEQNHRYQAVLSDLSGCDIQTHSGDYQIAVRKVRNWIANAAQVDADGPTKILNAYSDFQQWHYESQLRMGFSEKDIQDYPTPELLGSMIKWMKLGKPI